VRVVLQRVSRGLGHHRGAGHRGHRSRAPPPRGLHPGDGGGARVDGRQGRRPPHLPDDEGRMNRSLDEAGGGVLVVSQFTLYGDTRKGGGPPSWPRRPPTRPSPSTSGFVAAPPGQGPGAGGDRGVRRHDGGGPRERRSGDAGPRPADPRTSGPPDLPDPDAPPGPRLRLAPRAEILHAGDRHRVVPAHRRDPAPGRGDPRGTWSGWPGRRRGGAALHPGPGCWPATPRWRWTGPGPGKAGWAEAVQDAPRPPGPGAPGGHRAGPGRPRGES
jgi:hypothetical protein